MTDKESMSKLGKGPQILIFDASMIPHRKLRDFVIDVADELEIPYQLEVIAVAEQMREHSILRVTVFRHWLLQLRHVTCTVILLSFMKTTI